MEALENILTRVSVKKYKSDPIPKELIEKIVEAGTYAPTGRNLQAPIILAVSNKEIRDRLSKSNAEVLGVDTDPFYGAPVVLVVLAKKDIRTHVYDGSLVMQNMMLAAHALGLGGCWIHRAKETFEMPQWQAWLKEQGIEEEYEGIGNCVIGYADVIPEKKPRKENWVYYID